MMTFGKRLRKLRNQKKLSQKDFGLLFGLAESTIGMYERDARNPDLDTIGIFADYFEVSTDYLLGRTDNAAIINYNIIDSEKNGLSAIDTSGLSEYQLAVLEWAFNREHAHFSNRKEDVLEMLEMFEVMYEKMKDK